MSNIKKWTRRVDRGFSQTLWHHVQSEIEDRSVTTCGRQMKQVNRSGHLEFRDYENIPLSLMCTQC